MLEKLFRYKIQIILGGTLYFCQQEQMMRKKSVTALDSRYVTMIENAFYYVDPPDTAPFVRKERPPMHEFIRKILYQDLMKANTDKVLRLMRKLDWENPDLAEYAVKCLTMAHNVKYYNIRCLASLLAGLVTHQVNLLNICIFMKHM